MENDEEYEHLPSEFYYPGERLDENSDEVSKTMPYNKLLTNLACSSRTEEYWPSVVFARTEPSTALALG